MLKFLVCCFGLSFLSLAILVYFTCGLLGLEVMLMISLGIVTVIFFMAIIVWIMD